MLLLLLLLLLILINVVSSYVPVPVRSGQVLHDSSYSFILKTLSTTEPPPTKKKSFWEEFRDIFFGNYHFISIQFISFQFNSIHYHYHYLQGAFTDAFNTKEDKTKNVTPLNYANIKEGIFSKHKANSNWRNDDIIKNFASKYIPEYRKSIKTARLLRRLEDLDEGELLESLDEYMNILQ